VSEEMNRISIVFISKKLVATGVETGPSASNVPLPWVSCMNGSKNSDELGP
jgi:hypothetical protein